jgi:uncharacterized protein YneF (UPF0154 family)
MGLQTLVIIDIILINLALILAFLVLRFFFIRRRRYKKRIKSGEKQENN